MALNPLCVGFFLLMALIVSWVSKLTAILFCSCRVGDILNTLTITECGGIFFQQGCNTGRMSGNYRQTGSSATEVTVLTERRILRPL